MPQSLLVTPIISVFFRHALPLRDIQVDFEINRPIRYQITAKRKLFHGTTDGRANGQVDKRTARQTDGQTWRTTTIGIFSKKKILKKKERLDDNPSRTYEIEPKEEDGQRRSTFMFNHFNRFYKQMQNNGLSISSYRKKKLFLQTTDGPTDVAYDNNR